MMSWDEQGNSDFSEEFREIMDLDIVEMTRRLNILLRDRETISSEIDDITMLGFEIL